MLEADIISQTESSWNSPVVIVIMKNINPKFCVDYRLLNAIMKHDPWSTPRFDLIFNDINAIELFETIGFSKGTGRSRKRNPARRNDFHTSV